VSERLGEQQLGNNHYFRLLLAILAPCFIAGAVMSMCYILLHPDVIGTLAMPVESYEPPPTQVDLVGTTLGTILFGAMAGGLWCLLVMGAAGLPAHMFFLRRTPAVASLYASAGLGIGAVAGGLMLAPSWSEPYMTVPGVIEFICICATGGLTAGTLFWVIRRPDRLAATRRPQ
jgi:hypothetical protein